MDETRLQLPVYPYIVLPQIFMCALLTLGPPLWVRFLGFLVYLYPTYAALHCTMGDPMLNYSVGSGFIGQAFAAAHLLLLTSPVDDIRHERDKFKTSAQELPLLCRACWAFCIEHGPRGVPNIPPRPRMSRGKFIRSRLLWALWYLILIDIAQTYQHTHALFHLTGDNMQSVGSEGYLLRCMNIIAFMATPYAMLNLQYTVPALCTVALRTSNPEDWPDMFGKWSDCYTIRKFWGKSWHQMLRRHGTSMGRWVCNKLGFQRGTTGSSYTQLYVAFFLSGVMHMGGDYMVNPALIGSSFPFFIYQAIAITAEDTVIALGKRMGMRESRATRVLGYGCTFAWLSWSTAGYIDWSIGAGVGLVEALPFSVSRSVGKAAGLL
ncbi:hypothetical protein EVG20_g7751 [Dentipellis fragilis]|uniref:Wax synthase domain-containing protein n=1 Tax=Dentipellis fragilis TaxID=205917 RepID=A0A4Y9YDN4_9AGAM|nr:hypothetical protein EVG20_g7751 [Dentipellis fragilis]